MLSYIMSLCQRAAWLGHFIDERTAVPKADWRGVPRARGVCRVSRGGVKGGVCSVTFVTFRTGLRVCGGGGGAGCGAL